ncbi:MAG: adenosylmethionine decarboxylase [Desulfurococcales archaeon]|nr:adenosylmethionine decarboxylase [Desulfurococcales archaeon]
MAAIEEVGTRVHPPKDVVVGKHYYANLYGIDVKRAWDKDGLRDAVIKAVEVSNITLLEVKSWKLEGVKGGVSVIAIVLESHITVHTWPNYGHATVDVYTCGEKNDPSKGLKVLLQFLNPKEHDVAYADRTQRVKVAPP